MCGQLAAPLNDAACVYRAQAYAVDATLIPNEGTREEPLILGSNILSEASDPPFVNDQQIGAYLNYAPANGSASYIPVPGNLFNGNFSYAIRWRPNSLYPTKPLGVHRDGLGSNANKFFYLSAGPYDSPHPYNYLSRFKTQNWATNNAVSETRLDTARTDTVVATWSVGERVSRLYVNGALEAAVLASADRLIAQPNALFDVSNPETPYFFCLDGKLFAIAAWTRTLTDGEVFSLQVNEDWHDQGGIPPPHVGVFVLRRNGVDEALPQSTTVKIDGVEVTPPTGSQDKIIEVDTP